MPLYFQSHISVQSWVEMDHDVQVTYEIDSRSECATFFFGAHNDYVLTLNRQNLSQVLELGSRAAAELDSASPDNS
ncbi:hypothetical protein JOF56_005851 [Kibdelosporangium banguiense]|uniref:DUF5753 domain-containing protein n=1 Tax=Kibdelosporangium banguiense TaxID=1365924 RepID=A0ABS4TNJ3_9PSEU|nr:hypothetical protein [Kibdelosporangium banguiense]MBP2325466.1 hypothetical protein [Kibdelosporangium banguiense]